MNKWTAVIDKNPEKEGLYLVTTLNVKTEEREIKTSYFDKNGWGNNRTIAWIDAFGIDPYQGKTQFDDIIVQKQAEKEKKLERERKTFELRLTGIPISKISKEMGVSVTTSDHDLYAYLKRKEGCNGSCLQCKYATVEGNAWAGLKCQRLKRTDISCRTGCRLYEQSEKKRARCCDCKHWKAFHYGSAWGRCSLCHSFNKHNETPDHWTCEDSEAKNE